ncbi:hypothetical protein DFP72DRAFT_1169149 [Ephemerocybe angulata]|uniref:Uncharacterized protein n=1 Tax=Ephemerocybe angulata TaxID=980116 RepID=A0A8H6I2E9_9AGAR|nr:hypothetical protein DFP72DRAFT_1169149 [Tulosesus angulatus]
MLPMKDIEYSNSQPEPRRSTQSQKTQSPHPLRIHLCAPNILHESLNVPAISPDALRKTREGVKKQKRIPVTRSINKYITIEALEGSKEGRTLMSRYPPIGDGSKDCASFIGESDDWERVPIEMSSRKREGCTHIVDAVALDEGPGTVGTSPGSSKVQQRSPDPLNRPLPRLPSSGDSLTINSRGSIGKTQLYDYRTERRCVESTYRKEGYCDSERAWWEGPEGCSAEEMKVHIRAHGRRIKVEGHRRAEVSRVPTPQHEDGASNGFPNRPSSHHRQATLSSVLTSSHSRGPFKASIATTAHLSSDASSFALSMGHDEEWDEDDMETNATPVSFAFSHEAPSLDISSSDLTSLLDDPDLRRWFPETDCESKELRYNAEEYAPEGTEDVGDNESSNSYRFIAQSPTPPPTPALPTTSRRDVRHTASSALELHHQLHQQHRSTQYRAWITRKHANRMSERQGRGVGVIWADDINRDVLDDECKNEADEEEGLVDVLGGTRGEKRCIPLMKGVRHWSLEAQERDCMGQRVVSIVFH